MPLLALCKRLLLLLLRTDNVDSRLAPATGDDAAPESRVCSGRDVAQLVLVLAAGVGVGVLPLVLGLRALLTSWLAMELDAVVRNWHRHSMPSSKSR